MIQVSTRLEPPKQLTPPPSKVRLERLLVAGNRILLRLDGWMNRWLPQDRNPLLQTGRAANLALLVAVATGVLMLIWYSPTLQSAYASIDSIKGRTLGGWVRAMHRYSSDLTMLLLWVHATRMFFAGKFTGSRWLPWVSGVALLGLVWLIGWTGLWLVWDQPAQQVALASMQAVDVLPVFGEPMSRQFLTDRLVPSLLFFVIFFLHMLLPVGVAAGLVLHLSRLNRVRLLPDRWLSLALIIGLAVAALAVPAPLDAPAAMAVKAESYTVNAWYMTPLALSLRFQTAGLWICVGLVSGLAAVPWLLGRRSAKQITARDELEKVTPWQTVVIESRCHACTQCVQDCPYDAVKMVPRRDGKRFESRAWVDPDRCVGCAVCVGSCDSEAMSLTWFDVLIEEARIAESLQSIREREGVAWLALVAGDIDGGLPHFRKARWQRELPGYLVEFIPTGSWVRPKFVERMLREGTAGVLIVRDAGMEGAARDGNRWIGDRLAGDRKPVLRPKRAGNGNWQVVDYDRGNPEALRAAGRTFRGEAVKSGKNRSKVTVALASFILALVLIAATVAPSHLKVANPSPPDPELVFSFKAFGEMQSLGEVDAEEEARKPVHMRGRSTEKPRRQPVRVRLSIDGQTLQRTYVAKGISKDGPSIGDWRLPLAPGPHDVIIELDRGKQSEPLRWTGTLVAEPRRLHVITYSPTDGFLLE